MRRRFILLSVIVLTIYAWGVFIGAIAFQDHKPHCPTEDSCTVDYHDGEWHITEVTP